MENSNSTLSELLDPIMKGDVVVIETEGEVSTNAILRSIEKIRNKTPMTIIAPKGAPETRSCVNYLKNVNLLVLGKDIDIDRLYELLRIIRGLCKGNIIVAIRLDSLFLKRDEKSVYLFLEDLVSLVQEKDLILIMTIDKRNVSSRQLAMFENLSTHVIDITERISDLQVIHLLRVKKSPKGGTEFFVIEIQNGEIILKNNLR